MNKASCLP